MFAGYERPDGLVGCRNLLAVVSLLDLANDVVLRIAQALPGAVAVLTGAGGLSVDPEAAQLDALRARLCANPNVGAVLAVGPTPAPPARIAALARQEGRLGAAVALTEQPDSLAAVAHGVCLAGGLQAALAAQERRAAGWDAVRLGLRSSSSSLDSARTVNPAVGRLVDHVLDAGGAVCFGEIADLAGVAGPLAAKGATPAVQARLRAEAAAAGAAMQALDSLAPDPTPTNRSGGIATLEAKGAGALRRLGTRTIASVLPFGDAMPRGGLHLMVGPGSAAVCLAGLAAAGCNLVVHTVGMTSATVAAPITPVIAVGPAALAGSRDLGLAVTMEPKEAVARLIALVQAAMGGAATAAERHGIRQLTLPGLLPPL